MNPLRPRNNNQQVKPLGKDDKFFWYPAGIILFGILGIVLIYGFLRDFSYYKTVKQHSVIVTYQENSSCSGQIRNGGFGAGHNYSLSEVGTGKGFVLECALGNYPSGTPLTVYATDTGDKYQDHQAYLSLAEVKSDNWEAGVFGLGSFAFATYVLVGYVKRFQAKS